jgi:hypothetical protein
MMVVRNFVSQLGCKITCYEERHQFRMLMLENAHQVPQGRAVLEAQQLSPVVKKLRCAPQLSFVGYLQPHR